MSDQYTPTSPHRELQQLSLGDEPLRSPRTSSSYTQNINADIQARLLAFQEQRQSKNSSPQDEHDKTSPLYTSAPPGPTSSQPSSALSNTSAPVPTKMSAPPATQNIQLEQQQRQIQELQRNRSLQMKKDKPLPPLPPIDPVNSSSSSKSSDSFSSSASPHSSATPSPVLKLAPPPQPNVPSSSSSSSSPLSRTPPAHLMSKLNPSRPAPALPVNSQVSPQVAARLPKTKQSLSMRRGMKLPGGLPTLNTPSSSSPPSQTHSSSSRPVSQENPAGPTPTSAKSSVSEFIDKKGKLPPQQSMQLKGLFANYSKYIDIKSGSLNFAGKLSLDSKGINFNGTKFSISADDLEFMEELGRGNYGTVSKVLHKPTGIIMAMKEVRLELDDSKFRQILMELEVLHKCNSPYIVDFYGAFFVEGAVYMCIEYMDGGSLDKIYGNGVDEPHLKFITDSVVRGLRELKEGHNVIHRDVKPTNILVSTSGKVKLCDFGVSGNLVASLAKTNIGCQSYMAPERIKSLSPDDVTYTVQSDIWSLGLSILETAKGCYPYPPETYDNIFSQLSAIVDGDPPKLPQSFTEAAQDFVSHCLDKIPERRPNYTKLLQHPWLRDIVSEEEMAQYIKNKIEEHKAEKTKQDQEDIKELNQKLKTPALHRGGAPQPQV